MELRAYYFGNMYLSSIQQGIQAAHVTAEMFTKYSCDEVTMDSMLWNWARQDKTMILLNAGYSEELHDLKTVFNHHSNPYPWEYFNEGDDALDGALTCVGIILPEKIYKMSAAIRADRPSAGQKSIAERIFEDGAITVHPDNTMGFDVEEPTIMVYSKWEYDLLLRLNNYGLAR
jgi:hypothetical protein